MIDGAIRARPPITGDKTVYVLAFAIFGCVLVGSIMYSHFFTTDVGATPGSVLLALVLIAFASNCGPDPLHPARLLAALLGLSFVVGPIDLAALRDERNRRRGHHMLGHMRMETYGSYRESIFPGSLDKTASHISIAGNDRAIEVGKMRLMNASS